MNSNCKVLDLTAAPKIWQVAGQMHVDRDTKAEDSFWLKHQSPRIDVDLSSDSNASLILDDKVRIVGKGSGLERDSTFCPICNKRWKHISNHELNMHIDTCLTAETIVLN